MKCDRNLTSQIKKFLLEQGADIVGIAPISRFAGCPKETHPQHYMPDATSVVSIGMHIMDGVCDVWGDSESPGKSVGPYLFYGYGLLNLHISWIGNQAAKRLLEYQGYKSLMFPPTWGISQYRFMERMVDDYPPYLSDFSHRHASVAAGLGEFGFSGLVLVPKFGPRVRLNSIITNAPLEPDPMYSGPRLCRPEKCDYKCVRECPTEALTLDETFTVKISDKQYTYTKSQKIRCGIAIDGLAAGSGGRTERKLPPRSEKRLDVLDFLEAHQAASEFDKSLMSQSRGIICGDFCGRCLHGCPAHEFYAK